MEQIFIIITIFVILIVLLINYHHNHYNHHNYHNHSKIDFITNTNDINNTKTDNIINLLLPINYILLENIEEKIKLDRNIELFNFYSKIIKTYPNENNTIIFDQLKIYKQKILNILQSYTLSIETYIDRQSLQTTINNVDQYLSSKLNDLSIIIEQNIFVRNFNSHTKIPNNPKPFNYHKDIFSNYSYHIH